MIRVMAGARFLNGMVKVSKDTYLFHVIHSRSLAVLVGTQGADVPLPLLFSKFPGSPTNSIPLYCYDRPRLSLARLILSSHPYALHSALEIGYAGSGGEVTVYKAPVVKYVDFGDEPVKASSTLMLATKEDMSDAVPFTEDLYPRLGGGDGASLCKIKQVTIDESKNQSFVFDKDAAVSPATPHSQSVSPTVPARPIIKTSRGGGGGEEDAELARFSVYTQLFHAISQHSPKIGTCCAASFNTLLIMTRSQNSLRALPEDAGATPRHNLFIKHVILKEMALENSIRDFEALYGDHVEPVTRRQAEEFRETVRGLRCKLEDCVFVLNSVCEASFAKPVAPGRTDPSTLLLMEKYFLMFHPRDKTNSINFGAAVAELIFRGATFTKILAFVEKFIEIKKETPQDNMFKIYALLTN
nr:tegument protein UL88 [Equid gammaherpesvirus 5]UTK45562.1 tegument protein UL88 [Equid gammaherpesvirus 5]UTK45641.1 tegument protein UL88 [Equid gammaherpesvirus 5]UTK45720.1 tegument protein UL88 [Equid gammaherpesvirus 5]